MRPRMGDRGVEDNADGILAVYSRVVVGVAFALVKTFGVLAKVQEGLCGDLIDVIARSGVAAVCLKHGVEELVILARNYACVAGAEHVVVGVVGRIVHTAGAVDGYLGVLDGVNSVVADEQHGCDEAFVVLKNCLAACHCAVGVAGDADAGNVNEGQAAEVLDCVVKTVCVVLVIPPCVVGQLFGIAVSIHADGNNNVAAAGILNIVEVLHLAVVVPAVADNDSRCGSLSCGGLGHQQESIQLMAAVGDHRHVVVLDRPSVRLNDRCADGAYEADDQGDHDPKSCALLLLHFSSSSK